MADLLIANAYVVTVDPERRIYSDGAIAIEGNAIVAVGRSDEVRAKHSAPHVIDGRGMMAIPGLIDGHFHPNEYLSSGIGDDVDILTLLYKRIYPYEAVLTDDDAYVSALGGFVEALKYGTTCINDPGGILVDATARGVRDSGIRAIITRSTRDLHDPEFPTPKQFQEDTETNLRESEALVRRYHNGADGRLRAWFSLRYVYNVSDDLCRGIKALADKYGVGIHAHAAAVQGENEEMQRLFGKRSLERFHDLGLFGKNLYLVHMGYPNEGEVGLLARHGVKVVHCPTATMLGAYGVYANKMMPKMAEAGVTIALGTDSATAGGHTDMIRSMYLAACGHKDMYADASLWGAFKALEMATIDGARACLWDDQIGSIETGKLADIALIDMSGMEWHPGRHPVASLVYSATGRSVDTVIVDGRVVVRHGVVNTVDQKTVQRQLRDASAGWRARANVSIPSAWPVI